jgi:hypothetical protein
VTTTYNSDSNYNSASKTASLTVNKAPVFTSVNQTTLQGNVAGSFSVTTAANTYPIAKLTNTALPAGLTFTDNGNGTATLSGTPVAADQAGTYNVTLTASNGISPNATQSFTLTVKNFLLSLSTASVTVAQGQSATTSLTATSVQGYAQNLTPSCGVSPAGPNCGFNPATITNGQGTSVDTITNAPNTAPGVYALTLSATDANKLAQSVPFTLDVCQFTVGAVSQVTPSKYQFMVTVTPPFASATSCQWTAKGSSGISVVSGGGVASTGAVTFTAANSGTVILTFVGGQSPFQVGSVGATVIPSGASAVAGGSTGNINLSFAGSAATTGTYNLSCASVTEVSTGTVFTGNDISSKLGLTCGFTPSTATITVPNTGTTVASVNIMTSLGFLTLRQPGRFRNLAPFYALGLTLPGIVWLGAGASSRAKGKKLAGARILAWLSVLLVVVLVVLTPSCGGGFQASFTNTQTQLTPTGQYVMTVVAANTNKAAQSQFTFSVPFAVAAPH